MKKSAYIVFFILLLFIPGGLAKQGHMRLLAVKESSDGFNGSIADLYLEVNSGSGRVFLETFPLTKVDTQLSTRFAKEIACDYLNEDCSKYDFFYTIRSDAPIIGGPSAGAAITFLTISLLDEIPMDEDTTVTGTINSGGIIGTVGGLRPKIDAASEAGIKRVMIPSGTIVKEDNETINLTAYGKERGVEIIEASTIEDMFRTFTGMEVVQNGNLTIDSNYSAIMQSLASKLCEKSEKLRSEVILLDKSGQKNITGADELYDSAMEAVYDGLHYTSASYCYGANVKYQQALYELKNLSESAKNKIINVAQRDISNLKGKLTSSPIETITDLEAFMIVNDRLIEGEEYIQKAADNINDTQSVYYLAYGMERISSAYSWFEFFVHTGKKLDLDEEAIKTSCQKKISEAEERYQYVSLFISKSALDSTKDSISDAYNDLYAGEYALCLFKASKAKAEADLILSVVNTEDGQTDILLQQKLDVSKRNIIRELSRDNFPVLGYSYYEYANSLKDDGDEYSALLYAEYALELSALDIYFREKNGNFKLPELYIHAMLIFIWGFLLGLVVGLIIKVRTPAKKPKKNVKWTVRSVRGKRRR